MHTQKKVALVSLAILLVGTSWWTIRHSHAREASSDGDTVSRKSVELTVYAQDFGMIHETRPMQLTQGSNHLHIQDVSKEMDPQSILLQWQGESKEGPQIVAHSYDLGVANNDELLKRYLGQQVEVVRYGENGHEAERQAGTLMVASNGNIVLESDGKFYVQPPGTIVAPTHGDIVTIPQLSVQADSAAAQNANLDVTYLTRGLSWNADYVATLSPNANTLALQCWATVTNRTGANYPNAKVTLVAGTPNRAVKTDKERQQMNGLAEAADADYGGRASAKAPALYAPQKSQVGAAENVGDFYAYPIKNPTTVVQEQMNRLLMLDSRNVSVKKDYSTRPPQLTAWDDYYGWGFPQQPHRGEVGVSLTFFNREKDGLGAPLPQGALRLYEADKSGSLRYAGAANIQDTPKEQRIDVTLSRAFDVFTEWRLVNKKQVKKHLLQKQVELLIHNEKAMPVDVRVVQAFQERWTIVAESNKHMKLDASSAQWTITVPAGAKTPLTFTVNMPD